MLQDALPPTAQVVAEVIGKNLTLKLAREVHYRSLYVPFKITPTHWIARCIGYPAAVKLQEAFVGEMLPLASCRSVELQERNLRIVQAYRMGASKPAIALMLGLSLRHVQRVIMQECVDDEHARSKIGS